MQVFSLFLNNVMGVQSGKIQDLYHFEILMILKDVPFVEKMQQNNKELMKVW